MATVGQQLTSPETGWKRYDQLDPVITFLGNWVHAKDQSNFYLNTNSYNSGKRNVSYKFGFTGTKIRIIGLRNTDAGLTKVTIDGITETYSSSGVGSAQYQTLLYEKTDLFDGKHTIEVTMDSGNYIYFDAIDIDSTGYIFNTIIKTRLEDMVIGDKIGFTYHASEPGVFGLFGRLGNAEAYTLGPVAGAATGLYRYYFIYVGNDFKGRMVLVADRNVQHSISWDSLNAAGISTTTGVQIDFGLDPAKWKTNIRLLTGGISSASTANSEWNKYIVNGPYPGDNTVWNWSGVASWTSTSSSLSTRRVLRGASSASHYLINESSSINSGYGFRPVLVAEALAEPIKHLIYSNYNYMKWNSTNKNWDVISDTLPTKQQFIDHGMDALPDWSALSQLTGEIEIVTWTEEENAQRYIEMIAIPQDQIVLPTKDINIRSVENIDSFTLHVMQEGQGVIKTAVSFDSGLTWYTRSSGMWVEMGLNNIKTEGMTPVVLNAITSSEWAALRGTSSTVRFAYHLSVEDVTDLATVNDLVSQMDMKGTWRKAVHGTDYDYEYPNNDQLTVTIYQSGDYKINY